MAPPPRVRFNHMALTLPKGTIDKQFKADLDALYCGVFGWEARDIEVQSRTDDPCYLLLCNDGHALLLVESDTPMQAPGFDHLGLHCELRSEVDEMLEGCRQYREKDPRVELSEYPDLKDYGFIDHAFKVRYLLPIQFDVNCHESLDGVPQADHWHYVPA